MKRTYELALVLDPSLGDEEVAAMVDEYKKMITDSGATIAKEESWGKRALAYPIRKMTEGRYVFLFIVAEDAMPPIREIEYRLRQNESVLRYLTVRTDEALKRALSRSKVQVPAAEAVGFTVANARPEAAGAGTEAAS